MAWTAALFLGAAGASAKTAVDVSVGWGDRFRPGRWTPLYVTVSDSTQRQAVVEVYAPTDRRYAMRIREGLAIGPTPVTIPIYVPVSYELNETSISIHDADSYKRLENVILSDQPAFNGAAGPQAIGNNQLFIGISGKAGTERLVQSQFQQPNIATSYLAPSRLPATSIGYDMLDVLVLNQPDLGRISVEQQQAIVDWVRSGGLLVMWPGPEPVPASSPLLSILPAAIGENRAYAIGAVPPSEVGLPARFSKLTGRELTSPTADAKPIAIFENAAAATTAHRRWVGYGQVMLLPVDVSTLVFNDNGKALAFWRRVLKDVVAIPVADKDNNNYYPYGVADPSRAMALRSTMDWISDIPGAGRFGFTYVAGVLLVMMFIVGPVDWFVLKKLGRQPWTWVTMSGWVALVTLGAIYIGHIFKSGEVFFRTASVIDEAGGSRVAAVDVAGIYSPQTTRYNLSLQPESWWRPASEINPYGASGLQLVLDFHQDYRGNRPTPIVINVWNMRFIEGADHSPAAQTIDAKLRRNGNRVIGTISNRGELPLSALRVRTQRGMATIKATLAPGQSTEIDAALDGGDRSLLTTRPTSQEPYYRMNRQQAGPTSLPSAITLNGIADRRSQRIDQVLADRDDVAVVYAEFESNAPPPRIGLNVENPNVSHRGVIRTLVPLE
ncbi:MAG: hypothetical protein ABIP55_09940 [Tepidisphaeraceae bacterium]